MSSTYRILCLSHDPAMTAGESDWQSGNGGREAAVECVSNRVALMPEHRDCDLLIGRYSYPLVEVGCPPSVGRHRDVEWVDVGWLRILARYAELAPAEFLADSLTSAVPAGCWTPERLHRLRHELGTGR